MKKTLIHKWVLGGLSALALSSQAQTFQYSNGDLLIGLRNEAGGGNDLVIDAGPISGYTNQPVGTVIPISSLTGAKLAAAFGTTNGLAWSGAACFDAFAPAAYQDTLFVTRPRSHYVSQSTPWAPNSSDAQDYVVGKIDNVGNGAVAIGAVPANSANTTTNTLIESDSDSSAPQFSYASMVETKPVSKNPNTQLIYANWQNTFWGNPEQYSDVLPARADLYKLPPGGPTTYVGYFEFSTNGALAFHSGPSPIQSQITKVQRSGTTTTVFFTTGLTGTYTLLYSDDLTAPLSTWTTVSSVSGNGVSQVTNSIPDTTTDAARFYTISSQ